MQRFRALVPSLVLASTLVLNASVWAAPPPAASAPAAPAEPEFKRFSIDVGGSSNFSKDTQAFEAHLGLNIHLLSWLTLRNAPFVRKQTDLDPAYGLDTSLLGSYGYTVAEGITPRVMLGGGYRFITGALPSAPFLEGGVGGMFKGINVNVTAKHLFRTMVAQGAANETIYSVNFSGGTSF